MINRRFALIGQGLPGGVAQTAPATNDFLIYDGTNWAPSSDISGVALGGGTSATLGTIGGSGPTSSAQSQWLEIQIGGASHWIPVWT